MAFSTIQGSGGAPDSFVGTSGVDAIVIVDSTGNYFLGAQGANDSINFQTTGNLLYTRVVSNTTMKGGSGADTFTWAGVAATTYVSSFINANADNDTLTFLAGDQFLTSTVQGGQGNDALTINSALTNALVNGNKDVDTILANNALITSSVLGGEGNDIINLTRAAVAPAVTNSVISGDKGNDTILTNNLAGVAAAAFSANGSSILGGDGVDTINASGFGLAGETIYIHGNVDDDTITGSLAATESIFGGSGSDTITTQATAAGAPVATSTITGGDGRDTMNLGSEVNVVNYTAIGQGGAAASATSTSNVAGGDVITGFLTAVDDLNFQASSLSGVASAATVGAAGAWNMNNAGVYIADTATFAAPAAAATYANLQAAIGNVTGDAGDTGYYAFVSSATVYTVVQVTLGTTKDGTTGLNAGDQVAVLGTVATTGPLVLTAADVTFLG